MAHLALTLYGVLVLAAQALPALAAEPVAQWTAVMQPGAQQLDVLADKTGYRYRIFVSVPTSAPPKEGYPVLYVLDGNAAFPVASFLARSAEGRRQVTGHVPPLIVGIGYPGDSDFDVTARKRDYTLAAGKPDPTANEGGADLFLDFIEQELRPLLATRYQIDVKRQALFGHSFGGLFVLHALFTRPESFTTYLASSPSIWWQDKALQSELPEPMKPGHRRQARVQISVGALEDQPPKGNYSSEMLAMRAKRPMVVEARNLATRLQRMPGWEDKVVYHELEGENHGTAWLPAMARGMQFFLEQP